MKSVGLFYCFHCLDDTPTLQILVYKISAHVPKLTTLTIDFSIKLPTRWYITTLVPRGVQRNDFFLESHRTDYWGLSAPANEHLLYKIRLQGDFLKLATYDWSDKRFLLTSKFCPQGLSAPALGLYTCIKSWKNCIKSYRFFFNL